MVELGEEEAAYLPTTTTSTTDPAASFSDSRARLWRNRLHPATPVEAKHSETRSVHFLWAFRIAWHAVSLGDLRAV